MSRWFAVAALLAAPLAAVAQPLPVNYSPGTAVIHPQHPPVVCPPPTVVVPPALHAPPVSNVVETPSEKVQLLDLGRLGATDDSLPGLARFTNLKSLHLDGTKVTDAGIKTLAEMPKLETLSLARTAVTDAGLKTLAGSKSLKRLVVIQTAVTDDGMAHVRDMKGLTELDVAYTKVTAKGVAKLAGMNLERLRLPDELRTSDVLPHYLAAIKVPAVLDLEGWAVDDTALAEVGKHKQVERLNVFGPFTDAGMKHVAGLTRLTGLHLDSPKVTAAGVKLVAGLPKLRSFSTTHGESAMLTEIGTMSRLTYLGLDGFSVGGDGMRQVAKLTKLETLNLRELSLADSDLMLLAELKDLKWIDITFSGVSEEGKKAFKAKRPKCELYEGE